MCGCIIKLGMADTILKLKCHIFPRVPEQYSTLETEAPSPSKLAISPFLRRHRDEALLIHKDSLQCVHCSKYKDVYSHQATITHALCSKISGSKSKHIRY